MTPLRNHNYVVARDIGEMLGISTHMARKFILLADGFPKPETHKVRLYWKRTEVEKYLKKHFKIASKNL